MRGPILGLVLALSAFAVLADDDGCTCEVRSTRRRRSAEWGYSMASTLVDSQTMRINALTKMVDELEEKLHKHDGESGVANMVHDLEQNIIHQEVPLCDKEYEFSCGRESGQCVSEILTCDGGPDCDNGHDEDDEVCSNPVKPGVKWHGTVHWTGCTDEGENEIELMVTGNKRYEWFPSRIKLTARATVTHTRSGKKVKNSFGLKGSYSFGLRTMELEPKDEDGGLHIAVVCRDGGRTKADCRFLSLSDMHECGTGVLVRE